MVLIRTETSADREEEGRGKLTKFSSEKKFLFF